MFDTVVNEDDASAAVIGSDNNERSIEFVVGKIREDDDEDEVEGVGRGGRTGRPMMLELLKAVAVDDVG